MFIKKEGKGPRIFVGLHGWSGDHRTFDPILRHLPPDATFISFDLPGCGRSERPAEWRLETLALEVADGIRNAGHSGITLVGNCSGAILGLLAAPLLEEKLERLVLIDPFAYTPWYFRIFVDTSIGRYAYYSTFANPIGRWITNLSLRDHRMGESDLTESFGEVDHDVAYTYLKLLTSIAGIERFRSIRQPVTIVYGTRTFGAIKRSVKLWRDLWPQAIAIELAGAAHLPIQEDPEGVSRVIFGRQP